MNQLYRPFLLMGLTVAILLAMHVLPTLGWGDITMRRVNVLSDVLPEVYRQRDAIDVIPPPPPPKKVADDSKDKATTAETSEKVKVKPVPKGMVGIDDYSGGAPGGMDHFRSVLRKINQMDRPVRIAYFGDSFIEGDVLTCDLREQLQCRYGGQGVGWVDCVDKLAGFRRTAKVTSSGLADFEVVTKPFDHRFEGISQRYYRPSEGGRFSVQATGYKKHAAQCERVCLFLRTEGGTVVEKDDGSEVRIEGRKAVQCVELARGKDIRTASCRLKSVGRSTYLYSMTMESDHGVVLDNFSMRGSSGATLAQIPAATLSDFARLRPYDLIILHFGLNVLNEKAHAANYKAYAKKMETVVNHLRQAYPEASVLIVSVPDRDQRTAAGIRTMNGVESLVGYQQILASDTGVAFFNLFQAMGGRESMSKLVARKMANKDYAHLSFGGGAHVSQFIYKAITWGN